MKQWGGDQNYRPEKKAHKKPSRAARHSDAQSPAEKAPKNERDYRVGKTIAGATDNARQRNLEHIAARKKKQRRGAILAVLIVIAMVVVGITVRNYIIDKAAQREEEIKAENPLEPTVTIVDENVGNNVSERVKVFVARLEKDAKDLGKVVDHVVLPFQKARELFVYFEGRNEYYKMTTARGSAVQMEDAERMMRYLDGKGLKPGYVDIRVEGKAYYK